MPLSSSGIAAGQIIKSAEVLQFFNLLTGVMTDQTVNIANQIVCNSLSVAGIAGDTSINKGGRIIGAVNGTAPTGGPYLVGDTVIDRTNGTFMVCTVAGSPGTWQSVGPATPFTVGVGGTGRTSFTAHGILLGNGTNGLNVTAAGGSGLPLLGQGAADPSFGQVSSAGIANNAIGSAQIAANAVTNGKLGATSVNAANLNTGVATAINGNATTTSTTAVSLGVTANLTSTGGDIYVVAAGEIGGGGAPADLYVFLGDEGIARLVCGANGAVSMAVAGVWHWSGGSFGAGVHSVSLYGSSPNGNSINFNPVGFVAWER